MKVVIIDFQYHNDAYFSQEMAGNFGIKAWIGKSFLARLITYKKKQIKFPVIILAYIAAILKENKHQVKVINDEKSLEPANLYLVHSSIVNFKKELQLCQLIKKQVGAKVGVLGPFASFKPDIYRDQVDFIIAGEPEYAIKQILDKKDIPQGVIKSQPIANLDQLPYPAWEKFQIDRYSFRPVLRKKPFLEISASRGCSFACTYCPYKAYYGNYRGRKVDSVIREIDYLFKKFAVRTILFRDSNFTYNKPWIIDLAKQIIDHDFRIEWSCETRLDLLDTEILDICRQAGLRHIGVGIETADENLLARFNRVPIDKDQAKEIINYCRKIGISVLANYIFGLPGDSRKNITNTIRYAQKLNTSFASFHPFQPYPGTKLYEQIKDNIDDHNDEKSKEFYPGLPGLSGENLFKLLEKAYIKYYYRPAWIFKHGWRFL